MKLAPGKYRFFGSLNRHMAMNTVTAERASNVCAFMSIEARCLYTTKCMLNPLTALLFVENEDIPFEYVVRAEH